ncbi:MAG: ABC transporter substrate-binding protein [Anaerolineales bacterium]|nr:ABC transporter substrate-binding protein [Anaerolineales bacterium]
MKPQHQPIRNSHTGWMAPSLVLAAALLLGGCAGAKPKTYQVGILSGLNFISNLTEIFQAKMTELGYVEGENIAYDVRKMDFDMAGYQAALRDFVEADVDLILVFPTEAAQEAKKATEGTDIPVVFTFANTEETGLVDSISAPGGNVTGVRYPGPDLALKRFEVMMQMDPSIRNLWIPYQRGYPIVGPQMEVLKPVVEKAGVNLIEFPADGAAELQAELDARAVLEDPGIDAILFLSEPLAVTPGPFEVMAEFAYAQKIPIGGAMMSSGGYSSVYGIVADMTSSGEEAAMLADKIFRGTKPADIPVISAESYFSINVTAAEAVGITVPDGLLVQANEVMR